MRAVVYTNTRTHKHVHTQTCAHTNMCTHTHTHTHRGLTLTDSSGIIDMFAVVQTRVSGPTVHQTCLVAETLQLTQQDQATPDPKREVARCQGTWRMDNQDSTGDRGREGRSKLAVS